MSINLFGYFGIFATFMLIAAGWALCYVHITRSAEDNYNAGCFWGIAVIVVPLISIPIYYLMRLGAERNSLDDGSVERHKEERMLSRSPVAQFYRDVSGEIKHKPSNWEKIASESNRKPAGFKPYNAFDHLFEAREAKQDQADQADQAF